MNPLRKWAFEYLTGHVKTHPLSDNICETPNKCHYDKGFIDGFNDCKDRMNKLMLESYRKISKMGEIE